MYAVRPNPCSIRPKRRPTDHLLLWEKAGMRASNPLRQRAFYRYFRIRRLGKCWLGIRRFWTKRRRERSTRWRSRRRMTKYPRKMALNINRLSMIQAEMPMVSLRSERTCQMAPEILAKSEFTAYSRINCSSFLQVPQFCKFPGALFLACVSRAAEPCILPGGKSERRKTLLLLYAFSG